MKIEFHYTYILIALGFILTGYFHNLIIFTSIIIIHELGHLIFGLLSGYKFSSFRIGNIMLVKTGGKLKFKKLTIELTEVALRKNPTLN